MPRMTAAQAKKAGKAWCNLVLAGGKDTALLGSCKVSSKGPLDADVAFLVFMLASGRAKTGKAADKILEEAKDEAKIEAAKKKARKFGERSRKKLARLTKKKTKRKKGKA